MSKPSITNCPNTFFRKVHSFNCIYGSLSCFACVQIRHTPLSGGYCGEVPPLPIPNREVKLTCADGTAMQCGRVGSRLLSSRASITKVVGAFLFSCGFYFLTQIAFFMQIVFCHADFADDADSFAGLFVFYSIISFSQKVNLDFLYYMRGLYIMNNPEQCCSGLLFHLLGLLVILLFSRYFAFRKQL